MNQLQYCYQDTQKTFYKYTNIIVVKTWLNIPPPLLLIIPPIFKKKQPYIPNNWQLDMLTLHTRCKNNYNINVTWVVMLLRSVYTYYLFII